jgi:predicted DNA-binding protein (MmcQ/YjbR family)
MTYDEFNAYCQAFTATTYVMQWGGAHVWKVGGKVFVIGGWTKERTPAYTFKVSELHYGILHDQPSYRPAPYLASRGMKWIQQYEMKPELDDDLKYYISESYRIVGLGLSKKKRNELGLGF